MKKIFANIDNVEIFSDDILTASRNEADHINLLCKVFSVSQKYNSKFQLDEFSFGQRKKFWTILLMNWVCFQTEIKLNLLLR